MEGQDKKSRYKFSALYGHHKALFLPLRAFLDDCERELKEKFVGGSAIFDSDAKIDNYFEAIANDYDGKYKADHLTAKEGREGGRPRKDLNTLFYNIFRYPCGK